jgi:hypothetical protein
MMTVRVLVEVRPALSGGDVVDSVGCGLGRVEVDWVHRRPVDVGRDAEAEVTVSRLLSILDRELELQSLAPIVGVDRPPREAGILFFTPFLCFFRGFVINKPVPLHHIFSVYGVPNESIMANGQSV